MSYVDLVGRLCRTSDGDECYTPSDRDWET